jgi:hypothetical protein
MLQKQHAMFFTARGYMKYEAAIKPIKRLWDS